MFKYNIGDSVEIVCSGEQGEVIQRLEGCYGTQYSVRYKNASGNAVEVWWREEAIVAVY